MLFVLSGERGFPLPRGPLLEALRPKLKDEDIKPYAWSGEDDMTLYLYYAETSHRSDPLLVDTVVKYPGLLGLRLAEAPSERYRIITDWLPGGATYEHLEKM